jgi:FolB domain-containing protein
MPAAPEGRAPGVPARGARADRLGVAALRCRCHIGVTEEERRERQKIEIDLELYADLEEAGRTADLTRTIDYRDLCDRVRVLLEEGRWHLVEAAAVAVLDLVLERWGPPVSRAVVRVRKYVLPDVAHVEVEMERWR